MPASTLSLLKGVFVLLAIMLLAHLLKLTGILKKENSSLFSQLIIKITLPALILSSLIQSQFSFEYIKMAGIMASIEITVMILAYAIAKYLKFDRGTIGAFILVSSFGMTTMLGYPLVSEMYPNNFLAMEEAVITSEFGVGFLLFILGPLIAMHFGQNDIKLSTLAKSIKSFLISPVFVSLIVGIILTFIPFNKKSDIYEAALLFLDHIADANLFLVAFSIGLILELKNLKHILLFAALVIILKLVLKPILSVYFTGLFHFQEMSEQIIFIETAMPSAILAAVFAKQYNCKPELVSATIMITLIISVISLPGLFAVFY